MSFDKQHVMGADAAMRLAVGSKVRALDTHETGEIIRIDYVVQWDEPDGSQGPMGGSVGTCTFSPEDLEIVDDALEASSRQEERLREALDAEDAYWAASRALAASLPRLREGARVVFEAAEARRTAARAALEPPHAKEQGA